MMPKRPNNDYRDHRGYYREDDDLTVTEGAIQREHKDWSTYRKTDPFLLILLAALIATCMGGGIAIGIYYATRGSPNSQVPTSDSHVVVPRFAGMNYNVHGFNGTQTHGINSTLSGLATTGTPTICEDDADETITVTQFLGNNKTASVDTTITTRVQMTLTQTLHKSPMGTTVSSAKPVNTTLPGSSVVTQSIPVVTEVLTTSVTETAYHTATAHQSNVASESSESLESSESTIASTSSVENGPPIIVTTGGWLPTESSHPEITSVFLTKTLTQTRKTTIHGAPLISTGEFSSTTTVTPTTVVKSTIYVTAGPLSSTTQAQCSHEVEDHTVYVTVTETFTPGAASSSSSVQSKTSKASSKMSSSSVSPSTATDTVLVTYTVTIDSLYPPTTSPVLSSSTSSEKTSSTLVPASKSTIIVTQVATQTVIVSIGHGTTVSSQLGHAGTPIFTSLSSSGSAQASTATDVVVLTNTITSNVFKTISASSSSHSADVQTDTQTSIVTVTASPSSASRSKSSSQSTEYILTTIYLTDRATETVTTGGMSTVTVRPEQSSASSSSFSGPSNSTRTETKVITASASRVVRTYTTTVSGQVFTSLITVWKNVTATATATLSGSASSSLASSSTSHLGSGKNTTVTATATSVVEVPVTLNTTITITGTPMMHPTAPSTLPPSVDGTAMSSSTSHVPTTYHYPTLSSATVTAQPKSTSTVVVVSGAADKHAEGIMGGCKGCTTWLTIFVLGLMVLV
ncbi:hypothetical protein BDP81DRAFT_390882 [Colletotrichum phormii]|uniref:Uncharacterized protein n=1 Tax=Colletotrichum phormii TaxID=359342 RepID=A0AAI9ZXS8_9PEZI|nr:uncharacterized protein BDP81DRAFT_390882 [Colletotrichum phormii]KAK1640138.1 hypothetical protein BDP81DRAFT_390882 [Colletotrichum phormii]